MSFEERAATGRILAFGGFGVFLVGLGLGFFRVRKQLRHDEEAARLECHFREIERELAQDPVEK